MCDETWLLIMDTLLSLSLHLSHRSHSQITVKRVSSKHEVSLWILMEREKRLRDQFASTSCQWLVDTHQWMRKTNASSRIIPEMIARLPHSKNPSASQRFANRSEWHYCDRFTINSYPTEMKELWGQYSKVCLTFREEWLLRQIDVLTQRLFLVWTYPGPLCSEPILRTYEEHQISEIEWRNKPTCMVFLSLF